MSKQDNELAPHPAPEIHATDIVLPHQTKNENQYDIAALPIVPEFVE